MAATGNKDLYAKLDSLYQTIDSLTPTSTPKELTAFGAFFSPHCIAYLTSMREHEAPSVGPQATISSLRELLKIQHVVERRILSRAISPDGLTCFVEMKNKLHVLGQTLDPLYETAVVVFDEEGLVRELKQYCCRSHVVQIVQEKTGEGPYKDLPIPKGREEVREGCCS